MVSLLSGAAARRAGLLTACLTLFVVTLLAGAGKSPMTILKFDPTAEQVDLFTGLDSGALAVRVVAHDPRGGNVFIENLSQKPLTIHLPDAVAMVQVLKQVGNNGFFGNNFGNGQGNLSGQNGMNGQQQGSAQSLGSGFGQSNGMNGQGQGNNNNSFPGFPGQGIFSIPAERVAQVPFHSVCLNYGKPDPSPRMTYQIVPLAKFTSDPVLQELLRVFGTQQMDQSLAQAAAWHLTDNLSWDDLARIRKYTIPGVFSSQVPIFSLPQLQGARKLVLQAERAARERPATTNPIPASPGNSRSTIETVSATKSR